MIESLFYFLVLVSVAVSGVGAWKQKAIVLAFGGLLLMMCGVLIMGVSPTSGIEKDYGTFVRYVGDNNYNVDVNVGYLNASNDFSLFILSNVFVACGFVEMLASLVLLIASHRQRRGWGG